MEILAGTGRLDLAKKKDRTYTFATQFLFSNPKDDDKEKPKGIIIERASIWITTGIFLFAGQKKKGATLLNEIRPQSSLV